ncbi:MAG: EAL domain-containing protein [Hyphomicrobiales bacterium]|nr:EAL domain-containing protein [Hyphomicrobiales bacterium]
MLLAIIAMLFVVNYNFGVLQATAHLLEATNSTLGSAVLAIAIASWVGVFSYAFRRRIEVVELAQARADAETSAATAGICDNLTGLPNRTGLKHELARRIAEADGPTHALIAFDVARFKALNEVQGHLVADRVLIELSDRLATTVGEGDFVARAGADEFHVILHVENMEEAELRALQIVDRIGFRLEEFDPPVPITSDAGVALFGGGRSPEDVEVIMRRADIALETSKKRGGSVAVFAPEMETAIRERAELETALDAAIDGDQISPHFQPVIDLSSGHLSGFEVLARWRHPTRGQIPPSVFIPIAEEAGLLSRLTTKLLRQACLDARDWPAHIKIAVNISPVDFKNPWLAQEILQILTEVGFPPQRLEIEITESALVVDHDQATQTLMSLKNQGISIALDDFGTGYASLHQLRMLPFDKIKIDQSFVRTMRENTDSRMIVKAIIRLSGSLGLPTTAEGIESSGSADILRDLGCTLGQGFLYSQAIPAGSVPDLIDEIETQEAPGVPATVPVIAIAAPLPAEVEAVEARDAPERLTA